MPPDDIVSPELARELCAFSFATGRQAGVLISRVGQVEFVLVGDHRSLMIPPLGQYRAAAGGRLKGLRLVHTHLAGEDLSEDDLMDLLFLRLDLMSMVKMDESGLPTRLYTAHLIPQAVEGRNWVFLPPEAPSRQSHPCRELIAALEDEFARYRPAREVDRGKDRAILLSVTTAQRSKAQESMDELVELARSDEVVVLDTVVQRRDRINPKWIMGKGKLGEIMLSALRLNANLLIFDQELNPSQIRSITDHTELRVIDRTQLILDIFARRALSREGKLQIEMAQLKYMLPRLTTRDDALSRLTGGIGGRGPGETKLEIDRRRVRERIHRLEKVLGEIEKDRNRRRDRRGRTGIPVISIVGYTNAGKSTLLNSLTKSRVLTEDRLFATLDPKSARLRFPRDTEALVTDTVGFIRNLPPELFSAFRATLDELQDAHVLLHVIDAGDPDFEERIRAVESILEELGVAGKPRIRVLNKEDLVPDKDRPRTLCRRLDAVSVSALDERTFQPLLQKMEAAVRRTGAGRAAGGRGGLP